MSVFSEIIEMQILNPNVIEGRDFRIKGEVVADISFKNQYDYNLVIKLN